MNEANNTDIYRNGESMKSKRILKTILIMEGLVMVLIMIWILYQVINAKHSTLLFQETSSDGKYTLCIERLGHPTAILLPLDRFKIRFYENSEADERYNISFRVEVPTKGSLVGYRVEWMDEGVRVILFGTESQCYILPFRTIKN